MKTYQVYKANPIGEGETESARLQAEVPVGEPGSIVSSAARLERNAEQVLQFLSHLPQGTVDRILAKLMQAKATQLTVQEEHFLNAVRSTAGGNDARDQG